MTFTSDGISIDSDPSTPSTDTSAPGGRTQNGASGNACGRTPRVGAFQAAAMSATPMIGTAIVPSASVLTPRVREPAATSHRTIEAIPTADAAHRDLVPEPTM